MTNHVPARAERRATLSLLVLLLAFVAYNMATSTRFPLPWQDEDMFTDVAANFAMGNGFTSSVWTCGDHMTTSFFACNAPLYPFVSGLWIKAFGFTISAVRSLNYLLIAASCYVLWLAIKRLGLIANPWQRLSFVPLLLMGYGIGINFRSGRYDCLGILLCSSILLAATIPSRRLRLGLIGGGGFLLPFCGLHMVPFAFILSCCLLLVCGTSVLGECAVLCSAAAVGVAALLGVYHHFGVLQNFFDSLHTESPGSFKDRFLNDVERTKRLPKDPSLFLLYGAVLLIAAECWRKKQLQVRSVLGFGIIAATLVPLGMILVSKLTTYYSWMAYIPLALALAASFRWFSLRRRPFVTAAAATMVMAACLLGLPLQAASALYYWDDRDMEQVNALAARDIGPDDWVYTDFAAYFAVRRQTSHVFIPFTVPDQYHDLVNVMILGPGEFERYGKSIIGGDWYDTGHSLTSGGHDVVKRSFAILLQRRNDLRVYRRRATTTGHPAVAASESSGGQ
ncbi:MAG: hypothetical protein PW789_19435 [Edaphobacter sp.]|uniref:hypothetical protein n=1 Tax=Edaphobacter sp. TaxID=1934404 RepID=UPI0023939526|nr:hypothetical protein [Edaphobacter sp.]MDE1178753.1 hypothetical protein [Edaphobacter sp.]